MNSISMLWINVYSRAFLVLCLLTGILVPGRGQKIEMEERVTVAEFPPRAWAEVQQRFPNGRRLKLYRELSRADSLTFEAKLISGGHWYSVEFFPDGTLLDIEKRVKFKTLPETTRAAIHQRWQRDFRKFKVVKCQEQRSDAGLRYEVEVRGKGPDGTAYYQYLFSADGRSLQREEIELRPSDMTLY